MKKIGLLLSLVLAHGVVLADPQNSDGSPLAPDNSNSGLMSAQQEVEWWQKNCINTGQINLESQPKCDLLDQKYRDRYNREMSQRNNSNVRDPNAAM
ncbi:hypothetical protein [Aeromonas cavernicola]|uniref:Uncharacterized protein n=1 Tax=Aeromonas cavernicola TaxID=1006623 RepID=A0A2H9U6F8_9GAMM|nr:hypothetical protein [Aeromonas cavernicola]PJG59568.1 hypothetical protein CUC53_06455 [Aeromonas cavernicola]